MGKSLRLLVSRRVIPKVAGPLDSFDHCSRITGFQIQNIDLLTPVCVVEIISLLLNKTYCIFLQSYVSCGIGVQYVGYTTLGNSIVLVVTAFISGRLTRYIGRFSQLAFGMILDFALIIVMLLWKPDDQIAVYFFVAAGWGFAEALIYVQVRGE